MDIAVRELICFCKRWIEKAQSYPDDLPGKFDKFTSLYIAFNRVYTEVGKVLISKEKVGASKYGKYAPLPDKLSATSYIVDYYGESDLKNDLINDLDCKNAIEAISKLILDKVLYLHENYKTGKPNRKKDKELATKVNLYDPKAVLELIYQARCNLFHGSKGFEERQSSLLDNASVILEFITVKTLVKLKEDLEKNLSDEQLL